MEDREEERGRLSPGALRPLRVSVEAPSHCHNCLRPLDRAHDTSNLLSGKTVLCPNCTTAEVSEGPELFYHECWSRTEPTAPAPMQTQTRRSPISDPPSPIQPPQWTSAAPPFGNALHEHDAVTHTEQLLRAELNRFVLLQRDFQMRALDAANALKERLEIELSSPPPASPPPPTMSSPHPYAVRTRLEHLNQQRNSALLQCRLDNLVASAGVLLDFELMRCALLGLYQPEALCDPADQSEVDPMLFVANYCAAQVYTRTCLQQPERGEPSTPPLLRMPPSYPLFYFNLERDGLASGRFVIEVHDDVAPRMARNFAMLSTGELGMGYRGCTIFQCWANESVITGDFEMNDGRGGRSVFEKGFFVPDETKIAPMRGTVGMRRSRKRRNHWGLVGSQFRIILCEMRCFTAIFGFVVEGLELVEKLSCTGNSAGKPQSTILISSCGKLN